MPRTIGCCSACGVALWRTAETLICPAETNMCISMHDDLAYCDECIGDVDEAHEQARAAEALAEAVRND